MIEYASTDSVALYVNAINRTIQQKGVTKVIKDDFWNAKIIPILYPNWDSDRDKLETFIYRKDNTASMAKNKYQRNQKTGEYKWVSYEFDLTAFPEHEIKSLYEKLQEKYIEYRDIEEYDLDNALKKIYAKDNAVNWTKLIMIRKFLLMDSDWTICRDSPLTEEQQEQWISYRKKLRDIPNEQNGVPPSEVSFPITPTKYEKLVKENQTSAKYLSDLEEHYFHLSHSVYLKYSDRILTYLSIIISVETIDQIPVVKRQSTSISLDDVLERIMEEGIN